ncbi:MAG: glycosyltransferase [Bacteroidota bacterium]
MKIAIVIPAHNEEDCIEKTLNSLLQQSFLPKTIVVVDDHSSDDTAKILGEISRNNSIVKTIRITSNDNHQPGGKIINAFYAGYNSLQEDFDVICKFDADLIFPKNYLSTLVTEFSSNPKLGIFGGFCTIQKNNKWVVEGLTGKKHVRGALKAYRKQCFLDINGLIPEMGWDTLDELLARYYGWQVKTDSKLLVKHTKPTGERYAKSLAKQFGISLYRLGYSFSLALITSLKMGWKKKKISFFVISILQYLKVYFNKSEKLFVTPEEKRFIQNYRWKNIRRKMKLFN